MLHWMQSKFSSSRQIFSRILNPQNNCTREFPSNYSHSSNMLVTESDIFRTNNIKLYIVGIEGNIWVTEVASFLKISTLITMVLKHFYFTTDKSNAQSGYALVSVSFKRELNPVKTIEDEGISNYDEILLVEKYTPKPPLLVKENDSSQTDEEKICGPDETEIFAATKHLESRNTKNVPMPEDRVEDLQLELRKVFISLVEASASVLAVMPNSKKVFQDISSHMEQKMEPDKETIKKLVALGFTETEAKHALQLKRNRFHDALNWLLKNSEILEKSEITSGPSNNDIYIEDPVLIITRLLDHLKESRINNFEPDTDLLQSMTEMGFSAAECLEALKITGNNKVTACEWLIGDRNLRIQDVDTGLDPEGTIYKNLMKNPTIQLGLYNPKVLLAFLSILEKPNNATLWLHDPDTKPVLNQVFKIYHVEKHIMSVNQHVSKYHSAS